MSIGLLVRCSESGPRTTRTASAAFALASGGRERGGVGIGSWWAPFWLRFPDAPGGAFRPAAAGLVNGLGIVGDVHGFKHRSRGVATERERESDVLRGPAFDQLRHVMPVTH